MKLKTLDDHPELKDRFCSLADTLLAEVDKAHADSAQNILKVLNTKFTIPTEAFFFESETGEYCGRILLQGSLTEESTGHFGFFCLSQLPKHQDDFLILWDLIEGWFKYYGMKKIVGPYLSTQNKESHYLTAMDSELFTKLKFRSHETHRLIKILE